MGNVASANVVMGGGNGNVTVPLCEQPTPQEEVVSPSSPPFESSPTTDTTTLTENPAQETNDVSIDHEESAEKNEEQSSSTDEEEEEEYEYVYEYEYEYEIVGEVDTHSVSSLEGETEEGEDTISSVTDEERLPLLWTEDSTPSNEKSFDAQHQTLTRVESDHIENDLEVFYSFWGNHYAFLREEEISRDAMDVLASEMWRTGLNGPLTLSERVQRLDAELSHHVRFLYQPERDALRLFFAPRVTLLSGFQIVSQLCLDPLISLSTNEKGKLLMVEIARARHHFHPHFLAYPGPLEDRPRFLPFLSYSPDRDVCHLDFQANRYVATPHSMSGSPTSSFPVSRDVSVELDGDQKILNLSVHHASHYLLFSADQI